MVTTAHRLRDEVVSAWPLLQGAAAATLAWLIATHLARHHEPFFAPIAAMVALNTTTGERGSNVFRLLLGVFIGISVGEVTLALFGGGYGRLALAMLAAMITARRIDGARIVVAQAASGAILTVAVAKGEAGTERLGDALIGAAVALLFTQVLFTPEPVGLIRRAAVAALREMARLLALTTHSLREEKDEGITDEMLASVRELRDRLGELRQMMHAGGRIVRHSLYWRSRGEAVERETGAAWHLELLGSSLLVLTRSALATDVTVRSTLVPVFQELGEAMTSLISAPGDRAGREHAVLHARTLARHVEEGNGRRASPGTVTQIIASMAAADLIAFLEPVRTRSPRINARE